jgi:hypothetical protein
MRRTLRLALFASAMIAPGVAGAVPMKHVHYSHRIVRPAGIGIIVDQAKLVSLERPAKAIYIGNPTIADITVVDASHAFVLGKTFGTTNLIALDADGRQISNQQVTVVNGWNAVTYNQGVGQYNYSCTRAHCETMPRPGDVTAYVTNTDQAIATHQDAGIKNASGTGSAASTGQ